MLKPVNQIALENNFGLVEASGKDKDEGLELWDKVYFTHAVTTSQVSRKVAGLCLSAAQKRRGIRGLYGPSDSLL